MSYAPSARPHLTTATCSPALVEARSEVERATIAFSKGLLSDDDYWTVLDWAAECYEREGLPEWAAQTRGHLKEMTC